MQELVKYQEQEKEQEQRVDPATVPWSLKGGRSSDHGNEDKPQGTQPEERGSHYSEEEDSTCLASQLPTRQSTQWGECQRKKNRRLAKRKKKREECLREHDPRALTEQKDTKPASEAEPDKKPNEEEQEMAINGNHMLYTTKYGSEVLLGMKTKVSRIRTPLNIQVIVSKDLGKEEMGGGLEDLKALAILHKDLPKIMPERRR